MYIFKRFSVLLVLFISGCFVCRTGDDNEIARCVSKLPNQVFPEGSPVRKYLHSHKAYISLTTSPERLKRLPTVLATLDLTLIERVLVILPLKFGRNGAEYNITDETLNLPKVSIIRIREDLGPASKLLGALKTDNIEEGIDIANEVLSDPENILITVDDDIAYPAGQIGQLLNASATYDSVFCSSGQDIDFWGMNRKMGWPNHHGILHLDDRFSTSIDVCEGFGGVAYRVKHLIAPIDSVRAMDTIVKALKGYRSCYLSDDLTISYSMAKAKVARHRISNEYIMIPAPFSFGDGEDALHRGGGSTKISDYDINDEKYRRCYAFLGENNI